MSGTELIDVYSSQGDAYRQAFRVFLDHTDQKTNALSWLDREVAALPHRDVLIDAGAGNGVLAARLLPAFARTIAIEPNPSLADELAIACPTATLWRCGIVDAAPDSHASFIVCSHVFYYLDPGQWMAHLRHMAGWLAPGGVLAITIQNPDTDCMRMVGALSGARFDLADLAERFKRSEAADFRVEHVTVPAHVTTGDLATAFIVAEFMLNLTTLNRPPARATVEAYIERHFRRSEGNGYRFSCHQDFLRVRRF